MSIERKPIEDEFLDVMWKAVASWCCGEISLDEAVELVCTFMSSDQDSYINRKEQAYEKHEER